MFGKEYMIVKKNKQPMLRNRRREHKFIHKLLEDPTAL